tara:strand:- start:1322 stop:2452 length:1131 start_codon:yes stop_codon:yes gene_type:complete
MKFLNKKEQVYDLRLTSYGRYLFSIGRFKPVYYGFYDDNVIYDGEYAGLTETQNDIHKRVKEETQYLEGLILFNEVEQESNFQGDGTINYFTSDITPKMEIPNTDTFRYDKMIGDSYLDASSNDIAPAWKAVLLSGEILSSSAQDTKNLQKIPQINVELNYMKEISMGDVIRDDYQVDELRKVINTSRPFSDGRVIKLKTDDLMVYVEELNTALLTKNFDVEVFEVKFDAISGSCVDCPLTASDAFIRKYFYRNDAGIRGGFMDDATAEANVLGGMYAPLGMRVTSSIGYYYDVLNAELESEYYTSTASIGYYFNILYDYQIDNSYQIGRKTACKAADLFNKKSYYIDLDFDCEDEQQDRHFVDIYGQATEPEICK